MPYFDMVAEEVRGFFESRGVPPHLLSGLVSASLFGWLMVLPSRLRSYAMGDSPRGFLGVYAAYCGLRVLSYPVFEERFIGWAWPHISSYDLRYAFVRRRLCRIRRALRKYGYDWWRWRAAVMRGVEWAEIIARRRLEGFRRWAIDALDGHGGFEGLHPLGTVGALLAAWCIRRGVLPRITDIVLDFGASRGLIRTVFSLLGIDVWPWRRMRGGGGAVPVWRAAVLAEEKDC